MTSDSNTLLFYDNTTLKWVITIITVIVIVIYEDKFSFAKIWSLLTKNRCWDKISKKENNFYLIGGPLKCQASLLLCSGAGGIVIFFLLLLLLFLFLTIIIIITFQSVTNIFKYSNILITNIYSDIRSYQFFFYEYIRTFVRVKFVCTNIFGHSLVSVLECKT